MILEDVTDKMQYFSKKSVLYTLQYIKENVAVIHFKIMLFLFSFFFNMLFISRKNRGL